MTALPHPQAQQWILSGRILDPEDSARLEGHLAACPQCRQFAAFHQQLLAGIPKVAPASAHSAAIQARLKPRLAAGRIFHGTRTLALLGSALALILLLAFAILRLLIPAPSHLTPGGFENTLTPVQTTPPTVQAATPSPLANPASLPVPFETVTPLSSELDSLPFDSTLRGDTGCDKFSARLPLNAGQGLSQDALAAKLMETYLLHFKSPDMYDYCRIVDFKIEPVSLDPKIAFLAAEQNVDFVVGVVYSVQIPANPSLWVAGNGEISPHGWILKKYTIIGVLSNDSQFELKILGTGP